VPCRTHLWQLLHRLQPQLRLLLGQPRRAQLAGHLLQMRLELLLRRRQLLPRLQPLQLGQAQSSLLGCRCACCLLLRLLQLRLLLLCLLLLWCRLGRGGGGAGGAEGE
jgi:hypothetical protein